MVARKKLRTSKRISEKFNLNNNVKKAKALVKTVQLAQTSESLGSADLECITDTLSVVDELLGKDKWNIK